MVTENFELTKFRSGTQVAFFETINDINWYLERCGSIRNCNRKILNEALSTTVKLITPLAPHICEEIWEKSGNKKFVSISTWPIYQEKLVQKESELGEKLIKTTLEDIKEIQTITKVMPKKIYIIVAPSWKFAAYKTILKNKNKDVGIIIREVVKQVKEKENVAKYVQTLYKKIKELTEDVLEKKKQFMIFEEAKTFLEKQLKCKVVIEDAEKSKTEKVKQADVLRPAIYLE
jgi:leucyl-tRNA synthetase